MSLLEGIMSLFDQWIHQVPEVEREMGRQVPLSNRPFLFQPGEKHSTGGSGTQIF